MRGSFKVFSEKSFFWALKTCLMRKIHERGRAAKSSPVDPRENYDFPRKLILKLEISNGFSGFYISLTTSIHRTFKANRFTNHCKFISPSITLPIICNDLLRLQFSAVTAYFKLSLDSLVLTLHSYRWEKPFHIPMCQFWHII